MKRLCFSIALLGMMLHIGAQTLIKGNYQKGDTAIYQSQAKFNVALPTGGVSEIEATYNNRYVILDASENGFKVERILTDLVINGNEESAEMVSQIEDLKTSQDVPFIFTTDSNGKPVKIENYDEIKTKIAASVTSLIEKTLGRHPEMAAMKDRLIEAAVSRLTEDALLDDADAVNVFSLNGKTIKTGDSDEEVKEGLKVKSTYTVTPILGQTVVAKNSTINMTEDDIKAFVIDQLVKSGLPEEQVEMVKQNWGQMVAMGIAKMDVNVTETFRILKGGWMQDVKSDFKMNAMGAETSYSSTSKLVNKNF